MALMVQELLMGKILNKYLHPVEVYDFEVPHLCTTAHAFVIAELVLNVLTPGLQRSGRNQAVKFLHRCLNTPDFLTATSSMVLGMIILMNIVLW